ncbi:MAG: hypothetical protein CSA33_04410 [Desulfobulbus propionicus]|nr:MAG: hypothetical protein CSA33_04410 [Desulfobulbus propionicus]
MPQIQEFLTSPQRWVQTEKGVHRQSSGAAWKRQWVMGRDLCFFNRFSVADVPRTEIKNFLDLKIVQWSPFDQTGRYIVLHEGHALVWIWDDVLRRQATSASNLSRVPIIPETLLFEKREHASLLVPCVQGIEGQVWSEGTLAGSRWWPEAPKESEWNQFLLSLDREPVQEPPVLAQPVYLERPWAKNISKDPAASLRLESAAFALFGLGVLFMAFYTGSATRHWQAATATLSQKIEAYSEKIEPLLQARTEALYLAERTEDLNRLLSPVSQLQLMAVVAEGMQKQGARLAEWDYQTETLTISMAGDLLDPITAVNLFRQLPMVKDVTSEKDRRSEQLRLKMILQPR